MTDGLGVSETQVGFLVGVYALASAIFAIPLVSATLAVNRKTLLMVLLIGFAASNIVVAISSSYAVIIACRVLGGICAGVMWPMIAAYGTRLVPEHMHGKAITVIMSGNTLGISVGLPVMTAIGLTFGWRSVFAALGLMVGAIAVLSHFYLPAVEGEKLSKSNSPLAVLKMPSILIVLLLTFLSVAAHYGIYTYITLLVEMISFTGGIGLALLIFGIGSVISVIVSAKYIDAYLRPLIVVMLGIGGISMAMLLAFRGTAVYLQGRQDTYPKRRGLTRVKELRESGINVCFGQDSINDPWYPVGNGNLMNILDNGITWHIPCRSTSWTDAWT